MHSIGHRLGKALRRMLPVFAVAAALAGSGLPLPVAPASTAGPAQHAPALDTANGSNRTAVQPKLPRSAEASAKKRLVPPLPSSPDPVLAATESIEPPGGQARSRQDRFERLHLPRQKTFLAQPRAPPLSNILTPAA